MSFISVSTYNEAMGKSAVFLADFFSVLHRGKRRKQSDELFYKNLKDKIWLKNEPNYFRVLKIIRNIRSIYGIMK